MPIYDYSCTNCGRVTEVIHGINDHGPRFCPECGAEGSMRKALTAPAIVFKGSGWAKLDRRGSGGGRSAGTASSTGSSKGSPAGSKSRPGADADGSKRGGSTDSSSPSSAEAASGGSSSPSDGGGD